MPSKHAVSGPMVSAQDRPSNSSPSATVRSNAASFVHEAGSPAMYDVNREEFDCKKRV